MAAVMIGVSAGANYRRTRHRHGLPAPGELGRCDPGEMIDRATFVGLGESITVDEKWIVEGMGRLVAAGATRYRLGASVCSGYFESPSDRRKPDD
jgi:hypothetical protein